MILNPESEIKNDFSVFPQLTGIFALDKPVGPSSAQCLSLFKKLGQKKIGHAGTLDPFASGVLLVLLGNATKLADYIHEGDRKIYRGSVRLGVETDTWDSTGAILEKKPFPLQADSLASEIRSWENLAEQAVPPFSAAKHKGQCLYVLARKGLETPRKIKKINIFKADLLDFNPPMVTFRVICGSGVYIRSLAHSLGKRLGCGACLDELTREYSYPFDLSQATTLDELRSNPNLLRERLFPVHAALPDWERISLGDREYELARNGREIPAGPGSLNGGGQAVLLRNGEAVALGELAMTAGRPMWRIKRGLWN